MVILFIYLSIMIQYLLSLNICAAHFQTIIALSTYCTRQHVSHIEMTAENRETKCLAREHKTPPTPGIKPSNYLLMY